MNEYAVLGKRYLKAIDDFFEKFEKASGYSMRDILSQRVSRSESIPAPKGLIDMLDMLCNPNYDKFRLFFHGLKGFDGYCTFKPDEGVVSDENLRVFVSDMGAWQITLLTVMDMHILPVYWHACYAKWQPIFTNKDLQKLRKTKRQFARMTHETYEFLPKNLPTEPSVIPIEDTRIYQTVFYAWSEFAGYLKISSTITFPKGAFVLVNDLDIKTEVEKIVPYRPPVIL